MRVLFAGTGAFGVPCLEALVASDKHFVLSVITQPDRPAGRSQRPLASPIKETALRHHLQVYQPEDINAVNSMSQIRYQKPDLMVVVAYGQILKKALLELPERAVGTCMHRCCRNTGGHRRSRRQSGIGRRRRG